MRNFGLKPVSGYGPHPTGCLATDPSLQMLFSGGLGGVSCLDLETGYPNLTHSGTHDEVEMGLAVVETSRL
jgi:hypothetical protein